MIDQKEARKVALANVSFERKLEIYNIVNDRIRTAAEKGERRFTVTEEENLAIGDILIEKGFSKNLITEDKSPNKLMFALGEAIMSINGNVTYFF